MATTKTVAKRDAVLKTKPKDDDLEAKAIKLLENIEESWYDFSIIIYEIYNSELYKTKGFEKFGDYVADKFNLEYRTAMWRVQQGEAIKRLGITKEQCSGIGWTKFKEISVLMGADTKKSEIDSLLKKAKDMTARELQEFVKAERLETEKVSRKVTMTFKLMNEQANTVEEALKTAKEIAQTESEDIALEYICAEWLMNHNPKIAEKIMKEVHIPKPEVKAPHKEHANKGKTQTKKKSKKVEKKSKKEKASGNLDLN